MDSKLRTKSDDLQIFKDKTFGNLKYLSAEEKHSIVCDFGDKLYGKIKTSISV